MKNTKQFAVRNNKTTDSGPSLTEAWSTALERGHMENALDNVKRSLATFELKHFKYMQEQRARIQADGGGREQSAVATSPSDEKQRHIKILRQKVTKCYMCNKYKKNEEVVYIFSKKQVNSVKLSLAELKTLLLF